MVVFERNMQVSYAGNTFCSFLYRQFNPYLAADVDLRRDRAQGCSRVKRVKKQLKGVKRSELLFEAKLISILSDIACRISPPERDRKRIRKGCQCIKSSPRVSFS